MAPWSRLAPQREPPQALRQQEGRAGSCCENEEFIGTEQRYMAGGRQEVPQTGSSCVPKEGPCLTSRWSIGSKALSSVLSILFSSITKGRSCLPQRICHLSPIPAAPGCSHQSHPETQARLLQKYPSLPPHPYPPKKPCEERAGLPQNCYCSV